MLKDNENIQFLDAESLVRTEPQGFAPDDMVRCESCLRSNPPTRANCLYCSAALSGGKKADPRPAQLKPLDDSEPGYNCILLPTEVNNLVTSKAQDAAHVLKLTLPELERVVNFKLAVPVCRTATRDQAELLIGELASSGLSATIVSDAELNWPGPPVIPIRAVVIGDEEMKLQQIGGAEGITILWTDIVLLVSGRLITKRVESAEQKSKRGEREIIETKEFFADQLVMDLYVSGRTETFRITANNFDYSSLPGRSLMVAENFTLLLNLIKSRSPQIHHDDAYFSLHQTLEAIWPAGQRTNSGGVRRERPGKYSIEAVTENSNVNQFTRYSRLRFFLNRASRI